MKMKQSIMIKSHMLQISTLKLLMLALSSLILIIVIPFNYPFHLYSNTSLPCQNLEENTISRNLKAPKKFYCDLFSGDWVPSLEATYYTNATCNKIHDHQNCLYHGRPDTGFMKWRWKPSELGCELRVFDPVRFLEIMKGKSLAFVGDSLARNHMQSLLCMLTKVEVPVDLSKDQDEVARFKRYEYKTYNFTIEIFWSPYLVKTTQTDPNDIGQPFNVYLDEYDKVWTDKLDDFNYVIVSAGQWFLRTTNFYINNELIGCLWCNQNDITHLSEDFGFHMAYKTALKAIYSSENFKGVAFVRTFSMAHFENGRWDGDCVRTRPYRDNETRLEGKSLDFYNVQIEEFKRAEKMGSKRGMKLELIDVTRAMLRRPDGHPGRHYGKTNSTWANDCVHWCMPGPVDTWNELLLELLERDQD